MADRIYVVRHGETDWSALGRHTGRSNIPLNAAGERQAERLRPILARVAFARVLSSPLDRARRTAELAGFERVETSPLLCEVNYGDDDGKTRDEIRAARPGWDFFKDGPTNGETIEAAAARARAVLNELRPIAGNALVFAHGHILRILASVYVDAAPEFGRHLLLRPASVSVLGREHEWPNIEVWNRTEESSKQG